MLTNEDIDKHKGDKLTICGRIFILNSLIDSAGLWNLWEDGEYIIFATPNFDDLVGLKVDLCDNEAASFDVNSDFRGKIVDYSHYKSLVKSMSEGLIKEISD